MYAIATRQVSIRPPAGRPRLACRAAPVQGSAFAKPNQVVIIPVTKKLLEDQGTLSWPTWGCGASSFPWHYDTDEEAYLLMGRVVVTPEGGQPVTLKAGDFAVFPRGMSCTWDVLEPISKHYRLYD